MPKLDPTDHGKNCFCATCEYERHERTLVTPLEKIKAPFTPAHVEALNAWQTRGDVHPFTCGIDGCRASLIAAPNGWFCPAVGCDYTQGWAHAMMAVQPDTDDGTVRQFGSVADSGEREEFDTGSRRDIRHGKGRYDLLPVLAMRRIAVHFENGAVKYGDRNWEKGQPLSRYLDCAIRHAFEVLEGLDNEDHAAAVVWNMLAFMETAERIRRGLLPAELDDMKGVFEKLKEPKP